LLDFLFTTGGLYLSRCLSRVYFHLVGDILACALVFASTLHPSNSPRKILRAIWNYGTADDDTQLRVHVPDLTWPVACSLHTVPSVVLLQWSHAVTPLNWF